MFFLSSVICHLSSDKILGLDKSTRIYREKCLRNEPGNTFHKVNVGTRMFVLNLKTSCHARLVETWNLIVFMGINNFVIMVNTSSSEYRFIKKGGPSVL